MRTIRAAARSTRSRAREIALSILLLSALVSASSVRRAAETPAGPGPVIASAPDARPSVDEVMSRLQAKYKQTDKKYDTLADDMDKEVRKALKTVWLSEKDAGASRTFSEHPYFVLVDQLAKAAQSEASRADAKKSSNRDALLAKFPWLPRVELDIGLDGGSDRPVPANEKGFIALGTSLEPVRGFPELEINPYLYGLQEIVSWRTGVKVGKKIEYEGRNAKKPPVMETALPSWEKIRVLLQGSLPEVPLFAIPWLEHSIHTRLVERRKSQSAEVSRMDDELAFLDSKWNGFTFQVPYAKERQVVVYPMHVLMTDRKGFFNGFPQSEQMSKAGDLPFISIQTYQQYAQLFLGQKIAGGDFVQNSAAAARAGESFQADCAYLSRYKTLIDVFVRAILSPNLSYPQHMTFADYPKGKVPTERKLDPALDVARKHALLVWAYVGKDPAKLADFLYDNLLSKEANRFPNNVELSSLFTLMSREKEKEMLQNIAARSASGKSSPTDFEREFSPNPIYLDGKGDPASDYLVESFQALHDQATKVIQDAAFAVAQKEIGK
jgi:Skp family chaperone for outer membrane proteins